MLKLKYGNMLKAKGALIVTTNGFVTSRGKAVMGRGIAKQVDSKYNLAYKLGELIQKNGNIVQVINKKPLIIAFPVKGVGAKYKKSLKIVNHAEGKYGKGDFVPGFHLQADIRIIKDSVEQLNALIKQYPKVKHWNLPRPGCGAGELVWDDVYPLLFHKLDEKVRVWTFEKSDAKCFISGSASVFAITDEAKRMINKLVYNDITILVGDCKGADWLVQYYLKWLGYDNVLVCHTGIRARNNAGFNTKRITKRYKSSANAYQHKDIWMSKKCDYGLVLWDGVSRGSKSNINRLESYGKHCKVVMERHNNKS